MKVDPAARASSSLICGLALLLLPACGGDVPSGLAVRGLGRTVTVEAPLDGIGLGRHVEMYATCNGEQMGVTCTPIFDGKTTCTFAVYTSTGNDRRCSMEILEVDGDRTVFKESRPDPLDLTSATLSPHTLFILNLKTLPTRRGVEVCIHPPVPASVWPPPSVPPLTAPCDEGSLRCPGGKRCVYDYSEDADLGLTEVHLQVPKGYCLQSCQMPIILNTGYLHMGRTGRRLFSASVGAAGSSTCSVERICPPRLD